MGLEWGMGKRYNPQTKRYIQRRMAWMDGHPKERLRRRIVFLAGCIIQNLMNPYLMTELLLTVQHAHEEGVRIPRSLRAYVSYGVI